MYSTSDFVPIAVDLRSLKLAAEIQLDRQQQRAPATTLKAVLTELKLTAKADTKSNDYSKGIKMCQELQRPVVLVDRGILLHWSEKGLSQPRNYLDWPASSLRPLVGQTDSDLDDFLRLCSARSSKSKTGIVSNETRRSP